MFLVAAIAAATAATAASPAIPEPRRQATATVRIVRAQPLHFSEIDRTQPKFLRTTVVRGRDGQQESARLVEYQ